jgi:uncharacterized pyridoxal phosphate-containing UPF0001 family protein
MEYQVARLQDIVTKIQYYCKMNFKNSVDVDLLLETDGLDIEVVNSMIGAGIDKVGFTTTEQLDAMEAQLLPCKKHYLGELTSENLLAVVSSFDVIENVADMDMVLKISDINARRGSVSQLMAGLNVLSDIKIFGFLPAEISEKSFDILRTSGIRMIGISTYIPPIDNKKLRKTAMRKAATMYKMLTSQYRGLDYFSMNYHSDFAELIEEGVNQIRIGIKNLA